MSSLDSLFFSDSAAVLKEKEDLIHFQDVSLTPDASMEETELVPVNVVPEETSKKVLKEEEIPSLDSIFFSLRSTEPFAAVSKETEFVSLRDIISTSSAAAEALLMREAEGDLVQLLDMSLTQDSKERPADASVEEAGLICLNDLTSTSSDASETPEDILKGSEQMPLHDTSQHEVPESFTTNETPVETSKERDTSQDDIASLEPEYVVVSPSKSAQSMPEDSTEDCKFSLSLMGM